MKTIKFSHNYKKLHDNILHGPIHSALLLEVLEVDMSKLSAPFIDYDTDCGIYKLPGKGQYLMLIFQKPNGDLFTTLRRYLEPKASYYRLARGEYFEIVVETEKTSQ